MKNRKAITTLLLWFMTIAVFADSGIYICGHFRRDRTRTVPDLKASGYTFGILFNVHVKPDGTLVTDEGGEAGGVICQDGEYVFDRVCPNYIEDVNSLLAGETSLQRLEYCIGGWENEAYKHIAALVLGDEAEGGGTGPNSILYRNFKALKDAIPAVIAINNDIENNYVPAPHAQFHVMLYDLGFKTTIAPYQRKDQYWVPFTELVNAARPGAIDRNYLQCYGGGWNNNPKDWKIGDIPVYGSRDIEANGYTHQQIVDVMTNWKIDAGIVGGFYWNYNWNRDLKAEAAPINQVFGGGEVVHRNRAVAMIYPVTDYKSPQVDFSVGSYSSAEIQAKGFDPSALSSIKLMHDNIRVILYTEENNTGEAFEITSDTPDIAAVVGDNAIKSWTVTADCIDSLDGMELYIKNKDKGFYMKTNGSSIRLDKSKETDNAVWILEKVYDGLYKIINKESQQVLTVRGASIYSSASMEQSNYEGTDNQLFIVKYDEDSEAYSLISLSSLKHIGTDARGNNAILRPLTSPVGIGWELEAGTDEPGTGIDDIEGGFHVYPRTVVDEVFIESKGMTITRIAIVDLGGRGMIKVEGTANRIDVSSLPQGIYLLWIESKGRPKPALFKITKK